MNQSIVMRLLAAACATAVVSSLPAQSAPAVRSGARAVAPEVAQDPVAAPKRAEAGDKVQLRLAEVMAMLEEDDMTPEQQQKALKKLAEVADRLKQDRAAAPTRSLGGMVARAATPPAQSDSAPGSSLLGTSAGSGQSSGGGGVARVRTARPVEGQPFGGFAPATPSPNSGDKPSQMEALGVPMPPKPPKPAKAPKAPKAPKPPKDAPAPAAPSDPAGPVDLFGRFPGHDQAAHEAALKAHGEALRAHAEALRAHEMSAAKADEMRAHADAMKQHAEAFRNQANRVSVAKALDDAGKAEVGAQRWRERVKGVPADEVKVLLERVAKQNAETRAEVAEEVAKTTAQYRVGREMAARDVAKRYAARSAEAGEGDAEIRATIDEMRAEMREIRKLMQQIRERSRDEAPQDVAPLRSSGPVEVRTLKEGHLLAPARLKEVLGEPVELQKLEPGQHRIHVLTPDSRPAQVVEGKPIELVEGHVVHVVEGKPIHVVEGHAVHPVEGTEIHVVEGQPVEVEVEGKPVIVRRVRGTAASSPSSTGGGNN